MDVTFAQMEPHAKHAMSHRARAFEKLLHSGVFDESI
jgi:inosine/xanthosine triphosphate pyrophosphatase family protein